MAMPAQQINGPSRHAAKGTSRVPFYVPLFNPIARRLLRGGMPLGPNALLTVRGRTSGLDRTTPVAVVAIGGRRWVIGTFGEVNWVRNLRAAREATLTINRRPEPVQAIELSPQEASYTLALVPVRARSRRDRGDVDRGHEIGTTRLVLPDPCRDPGDQGPAGCLVDAVDRNRQHIRRPPIDDIG